MERLAPYAIVVCLGAVFLVVLVSFILYYHHDIVRRHPTQPLGHYVRALIGEFGFSLAYLFSFPLGYLPSWPTPSHIGAPILLVHGYLLNRISLFAIFWRLRRHGYTNVYATNLRPVLGPVETIANNLTSLVLRIAQENHSKVTVIAHSMGGVVLRTALQKSPRLPVAKVITLGTPHHGTIMAGLSNSPACCDMRVNSALYAKLDRNPAVTFVSIYSLLDNIVIPAESSCFGVRQVIFEGVGHFGLLYLPGPFAAIRKELRTIAMNSMRNPRAISVMAKKDFTLVVAFLSGEKRLFDMRPYLELEIFRPLANWSEFQRATIENGTVVWPGGQDVCPDTLYEEGKTFDG